MGEIQLYQFCTGCNGTGIRQYNIEGGGELLAEDPCSECGGDGKMVAPFTLDDTLLQKMSSNLDDIMVKLDV